MQGASRYTSQLRATEELARAIFGEAAYPSLAEDADARTDSLVTLRQKFQAILRIARGQLEEITRAIAKWREKVQCGEVDFEHARETSFLDGLRAFIATAEILDRASNRLHQQTGVYLAKPRSVGALVSQQKDAQKVLDSWQSPEWEVLDMRTVEYSVEQTRDLRARLAQAE